jgi:hypothetical protein
LIEVILDKRTSAILLNAAASRTHQPVSLPAPQINYCQDMLLPTQVALW